MEYDPKELTPYLPDRLFRSMGDFHVDCPLGGRKRDEERDHVELSQL